MSDNDIDFDEQLDESLYREDDSSVSEDQLSVGEATVLSCITSPKEREVIDAVKRLLSPFNPKDRQRICAVIGCKNFSDNVDKDIDWEKVTSVMKKLALDSLDGGRPSAIDVARKKYLVRTVDGVEYWEIGSNFSVVVDTRNDEQIGRWYYYLEWLLVNTDHLYTRFRRDYMKLGHAMCIDLMFSTSKDNHIQLKPEFDHMKDDPTVKGFLGAAKNVTLPEKFNGVDYLGFILDNVLAYDAALLSTPILQLDHLYDRAMKVDTPISNTEMEAWRHDLETHRDLRRKNKHFDAVSKLVSNVFPSKYCDVSAKFVGSLLYIGEHFVQCPGEIIVGGSGISNNFGPLIRLLFPTAKLHFVDTNELCRRAAESIPNSVFHCTDILSFVRAHPGKPVISDAVASYQEGTGKDRGTWIRMDENIHQLALLDMAKKGVIPWAVCKLPCPFGEFKGRKFLDILIKKGFMLKGSVRFHNGETMAVSFANMPAKDTDPTNYLKYLSMCRIVEHARQHAFIWGLFPSSYILKCQIGRYTSMVNAFKTVDEAFTKISYVTPASKKKDVKTGEVLFSEKKAPVDEDIDFSATVSRPESLKKDNQPEKVERKEYREKKTIKEEKRPGSVHIDTDNLKYKAVPRDRTPGKKERGKMIFNPSFKMGDILDRYRWYGAMNPEQRALFRTEHKDDYKEHLDALVDYIFNFEKRNNGVGPSTDKVMEFLGTRISEDNSWLIAYTMSMIYSRISMSGNKWNLMKSEVERYEEAVLKGKVKTSKQNYYWD